MAEPTRESERNSNFKACTIPTNPQLMGLNDTCPWCAALLWFPVIYISSLLCASQATMQFMLLKLDVLHITVTILITVNRFSLLHIAYILRWYRYMSKMYITDIASCRSTTPSWHHTNCCTLVGSCGHCSGCCPHNKTLLQEDISKELSFKRWRCLWSSGGTKDLWRHCNDWQSSIWSSEVGQDLVCVVWLIIYLLYL